MATELKSPEITCATDPHFLWEAERQGCWRHVQALLDIPSERRHSDYDDVFDQATFRNKNLITRIRTTPAKTLEGALLQIQACDDYEREFGLENAEVEVQVGVECRELALATIKRALAEREAGR